MLFIPLNNESIRLSLNHQHGRIDGVDFDGIGLNSTVTTTVLGGQDYALWLGGALALSWIEYDGTSKGSLVSGTRASIGVDWLKKQQPFIGFELGLRYARYSIDSKNGQPFDDDRDYNAVELMARINLIIGH